MTLCHVATKIHVAVKNGYESAERTSPEALFSMALSANGNIVNIVVKLPSITLILREFYNLGNVEKVVCVCVSNESAQS